jgi:RND family efflux transporter MFP subunit
MNHQILLKLNFIRMKTLITFSMILTVALFSCRNNNTTLLQQDKAVPVKTGIVCEEILFFPITTSGRLSVKSEQKLSFRTGGIIKNIYVQNGQSVKEGQLLASLNLAEIQAQVNIASEAYEKANRDFIRAENLYRDSVATLELYQNAKTALDIAKSNLDVARFNLKYSKIEAPSNGKILKTLLEENEMTAPGYPVLLFGSTRGKWVVRTYVSDKDMITIEPGDSARITLDPYPGFMFPGTVSEIGGMADPYTGTYEVEIILLNTLNKQMTTGLIARVEIIPKKSERLFAVPPDALFNSSENVGYVYQVSDTAVVKLKVRIKHISDNFIYVTGDLQSGTLVVTEGINYINENTKIVIDTSN